MTNKITQESAPSGATHYLEDAEGVIYYKYQGANLMYFNSEGVWAKSDSGLSYFQLRPKPLYKMERAK